MNISLQAVITGMLVLSMSLANAQTEPQESSEPPPFPSISLMFSQVQGEAAIIALGSNLEAVAAHYGLTPETLSEILRMDSSSRIDQTGRLFYVDPAPDDIMESAPELEQGPFPYENTFELHSKPGANRVIYLDFDGHTISGTAWNNNYGEPIIAKPYSTDSDRSNFSNQELDNIQNAWRLVSEDYAPFDVDVTTEDPGQAAITRSSSSDLNYGTRAVMTVDDFAACGCGGFAYVGVYDRVGDSYKPAFVFNTSLKGVAEAISHEVGHNLGLSHDGVIGGASYYAGHGSGATGWAPIMGVGYYQSLVQWSKGEYAGANQTQNDLTIIQNKGLAINVDDHGDASGSASALNYTTDGSTITFNDNGVITTRADVDMFEFNSGAGNISITVNPASYSPDLDIESTLYNSAGSVVANFNAADSLPATISVASASSGDYYLSVEGVGKGDPLVTGYTDYASLGAYTITGTASAPSGIPPVAVATADITNGDDPLLVYFSSTGSNDSDGIIASYNWDFGDGNSASSAHSSHTYYIAGDFTVTLTVTDNDGLTGADTVDISVLNDPPLAVATANITSGQAPLTVEFSSAGSNDIDGTVESYSWDFGDGASSNSADPTHTYTTIGTYNPTLTITDNLGLTNMALVAAITVTPSPSPINQYAIGETYISGTVSGGYTNTHNDDGIIQSITERMSGGKPANRYSYLEHEWAFSVQSGEDVTVYLNAWQTNSSDGDQMQFSYSENGSAFSDIITISNISSHGLVPISLPSNTQGNVRIRVHDTERNPGSLALDTVYVDQLFIQTSMIPPTGPPLAPSNLTGQASSATSITLDWQDNSDNESSFIVERSINAGANWSEIYTIGVNTSTYTDTSVSGNTTYWYRVKARNSLGDSGYTNNITVTTPNAPDIQLSVDGYKFKGKHTVDLTWFGANSSNIDIYRDGNQIANTANDGNYTDKIGGKGSAMYIYKVCNEGTTVCSLDVTVVF